MRNIIIVGIVTIAVIFAAGCMAPGATPDPIVGSWNADEPELFNDTAFTYIFNADGTGNAVETYEDPVVTTDVYNLTWKSTGNGTYEAAFAHQLILSEDEKVFTILGDGSGDQFTGDGFVGVWTKDTPEEFDGVLYEAKFVFYENTTGLFSWYYQDNATLESSYPLVWSVENGVYRYSYPDDVSIFTLGTDGILTETWDNTTYTYTRV
ncbi:hypothetical protein Mlab_0144 [Methanocorpusculum labreanum Z]|uniref:Uncharacterized protein n=1 Tax=Methanocorpusculum labreanum (strain ATCC 43576 / DSM 4855 / Z) TaxID=410358 RepID=A2SPR5_METLZ|nr:hypothetical protein [Methanocorpusculum labreanum]ABN06321.1 hypothetical protein Mlab_0144 [Methanocorpusculum labreanum Z]